MTSWMDEAIDRLRDKDRQHDLAAQRAQRKDSVITDKRAEFWRQLRMFVEADIGKLNGAFPDCPERRLYL